MSKAIIVESVRAVQAHFDEVVEDLSPHEALAVMHGCMEFLKTYVEEAEEDDASGEADTGDAIEDLAVDGSSTEDE